MYDVDQYCLEESVHGVDGFLLKVCDMTLMCYNKHFHFFCKFLEKSPKIIIFIAISFINHSSECVIVDVFIYYLRLRILCRVSNDTWKVLDINVVIFDYDVRRHSINKIWSISSRR
jgi:hypothetical protein